MKLKFWDALIQCKRYMLKLFISCVLVMKLVDMIVLKTIGGNNRVGSSPI